MSAATCLHQYWVLLGRDASAVLGKLVPAMEKAAVTNMLISDVLMRKKKFLFVKNSYFPCLHLQKGVGVCVCVYDLVLRLGPQGNLLVIMSP